MQEDVPTPLNRRKVRVRNILVIRFGALGDLCLLGWSLSRLTDVPGRADRRVTLVTKTAFAPLMERCRGVDRVEPLERGDLRGLWRLAGQLRQQRWDTILDAHHILRGHGLLALLGRRADARLRKDTAQRLSLLRGAAPSARLERTMRQRFDEVFTGLCPEPPAEPIPPWAHLGDDAPGQPRLGLAPGAQWDSKRWPEEHFAAVLESFLERGPHPARIFLGPREERWFAGSRLAAVAAAASDRVQLVQGKPLPEVASLLAQCRALLTNDSGLLHLAEAVGTPVLACFGPTVRQFGYFPGLDASAVLETELECRPCSRNGKRPCHRGDLACLQRIGPEQARPFLERIFTP